MGDALFDWARYQRAADALEVVIRKHFPVAICEPLEEAVWIIDEILELPYDAWNKDDVAQRLADIAQALRVLQRIDELPRGIKDAMHIEALHRGGLHLNQGSEEAREAALSLSDMHDLLIPAVRAGKKASLRGYDKGRTNWQAVKAIDACRATWKRLTGNDAPGGSDVNLTSPFGEFLSDAFAAMEIDGKPRSAMAAWNKVQSKTSFD